MAIERANDEGGKVEPWERETWRITVKAAGIGAPTIVRVKRALKQMLRTHGLRAVLVEEVTPTTTTAPADAAEGKGGPVAGRETIDGTHTKD